MKRILVVLGIWVFALSNAMGTRNNVGTGRTHVSEKRSLPGEEGLMQKITPVLYVESVEPCLAFWVDSLGFAKTAEVPEGDRLGFVILTSGDAEIMLQSYASLDKDIPALGREMRGIPSVLYIEVKDIREIERRLKEYPVIVAKRKTSYGATEIFYRSPGGHVIGFAQPGSD